MDKRVYRYFVDYIDIPKAGNPETPQEIITWIQHLGDASDRLADWMTSQEGKQYEVISHSIMRMENRALITYLLKRIA